jgi:glycosyltransferase involved in cell wall biosynthesis
VHSRDLAGRCHLLGERDDIPAVTAALDVAALTSLSEGFPNVIGEAMACGVPVAATSAGETPEILAGIGTVVPCGDPEGMAASWSELLDMPEEARRTLGDAGRARIQDRYGLTRMISSFEKLYQSPESGG